MRPAVVAALLSALPVALAGQELTLTSCPAADSGQAAASEKPRKVKGKWDDIEGVTTYTLLSNLSSPMFKDGTMEFKITAAHEGKAYATPMMQAVLEYEVIASSDNAFKDQDLSAKTQAEALQQLAILADDSVRFKLLATKAGAKESRNILVGRKRVERFAYALNDEQLQRLLAAKEMRIRAGDRTLKLYTEDFDKVRAFYRYASCNGGIHTEAGEN